MVGLFFHATILLSLFFALTLAPAAHADALTIFKYISPDYPFLPFDEVTFLIYPNPFAHQLDAGAIIDPDTFGTSLIITDNSPFDSDPMVGVLELDGVNPGVYGILEIGAPAGTLPSGQMLSTDEFPTPVSYVHVSNELNVDLAGLLTMMQVPPTTTPGPATTPEPRPPPPPATDNQTSGRVCR